MTHLLPAGTDLPDPVAVRDMLGGIQAIWRFPNDRGASVVNHRGSYGTELAVLRFDGEGADAFDLDYSTPITGDVIGHITDQTELAELLRRVRDLAPVNGGDVGSPDGTGSPMGLLGAVDSMGRML